MSLEKDVEKLTIDELTIEKAALLETDQLAKILNTDIKKGLNETEIKKRVRIFGENKIKTEKKVSKLIMFLNQLNNPMNYILFVAVILAYVMHDYIEASVILAIILINALISYFQEEKSNKAIETLKKQAQLKTRVIRDGKIKEIKTTNLVPGDIIILSSGDVVPSDCRIVKEKDLIVDESILTGEWRGIRKTSEKINVGLKIKENDKQKEKLTINELKNILFKNTIIKQGEVIAIVITTGKNTKVGEIIKLMEESNHENEFKKEISIITKNITSLIIFITFIMFLLLLNTTSLEYAIIFSLSLAIAAIPEGLPAIITISLAISAKKLAKNKAIIKKLSAMVNLAKINTIIIDKTGTLTKNRIEPKFIIDNHNNIIDPENNKEKFLECIKKAIICNEGKIYDKIKANSFDKAILEYAMSNNIINSNEYREIENKRIKTFYFSHEKKYMTVIYESYNSYVIISKGAIEKFEEVQHKDYDQHKKEIQKYLKKGFIALTIFAKEFRKDQCDEEFLKKLLNSENEEELIKKLELYCTVLLFDPPREEAKNTVKECQESKIDVIMATGDNITTAKTIANLVGISGNAIEGKTIEKLSIDEIKDIIKSTKIFARVEPKHKYMLVNALQKSEKFVAMTGDGINDAPALKKANVGIALGSGTDVAKEASQVILVDDNLKTIVEAIKESKTIHHNLQKIIKFLLSTNLTQIVIIIFSALARLELPLQAVHLLWINLITETLPAIPLACDAQPKNILKKRISKHLMDKSIKKDITKAVVVMSIATIFVMISSIYKNLEVKTAVVTTIVFMKIVRIAKLRKNEQLISRNRALIYSIVFSLFLQVLVMYSPLNKILLLKPLNLESWILIILAIGFAYALL